jgi:GntR family transcriptional regulator
VRTLTTVAGAKTPPDLNLPEGDWMSIAGLRRRVSDDRPIALSSIYLDYRLSPPEDDLRAATGPLVPLVEARNGLPPSRVQQTISAVSLSKAAATRLEEKTGAPALRTIRRYVGEAGRVIAVSDTLHPGDRFSYVMDIKRGE